MINAEAIAGAFIAECKEDYVGLWSLIRRVRSAGDSEEESQIRDRTLDLLYSLLSQGKVSAGQFESGKFQLWKDSPSEIVARIKHEWIDLGRVPNMGDIVWFVVGTSV